MRNLSRDRHFLGLRVAAIDDLGLLDRMELAILRHEALTVASLNLHGIYVLQTDPDFRALHADARGDPVHGLPGREAEEDAKEGGEDEEARGPEELQPDEGGDHHEGGADQVGLRDRLDGGGIGGGHGRGKGTGEESAARPGAGQDPPCATTD